MNVFSQVTIHLAISEFTNVYLKKYRNKHPSTSSPLLFKKSTNITNFFKFIYPAASHFFRIVSTVSIAFVKRLQNI
jgi:hypothetical protein